jgi:hypothetical protein
MKYMKNVQRFRGVGQFGEAYRVMLERDSHAPGSVDRVLMDEMVKLCSKTANYLYRTYTPLKILYTKGTRPRLELCLRTLTEECSSDEDIIEATARFASGLQQKMVGDVEKMRFGGIEEDIIKRGSCWCTELARVCCAICQVAGLPARLVILADIEKAYSGHAIIEVYRAGVWGAVDSTTAVVYRHPGEKPASTWDLMKDSQLIARHWKDKTTLYTNVGQFRGAAITNYFVWLWESYDYAVSGVNNYYLSILKMSDKGWPGGLRWLHDEDKHPSKK